MIAALALTAVLVRPGDTFSGIAASHGTTWQAAWPDNPQITNPAMIYPGEVIHLPGGATATLPAPASSAPADHEPDGDSDDPSAPATAPQSTPAAAPVQQAPAASSAPVSGGSSFQNCVIQRESGGNSQVMNNSGHYGLYQFDLSTWTAGGGNPADFGHASVSEQNQVFQNTFAARGTSPWTPYDGC